MSHIFASLPWYVAALFVVSSAVCIALAGLLFVRRHVNLKVLRANHDVAGFTFGIIGLIYGVVLGFTVVNVQERYNEVHKGMVTECNLMLDLFRDSEVFSEQTRNAIRRDLTAYVKWVLEVEWPLMKAHQPMPKDIPFSLRLLWNDYYEYKPRDKGEEAWYAASITTLNDFNNARLFRIHSLHDSQGPIMWSLLLSGAIITISFMYFFGVEKLLPQMIMTGFLAGSIAFILFLVYSLDAVFTSSTRLEPIVYEHALRSFNNWEAVGDQASMTRESPDHKF